MKKIVAYLVAVLPLTPPAFLSAQTTSSETSRSVKDSPSDNTGVLTRGAVKVASVEAASPDPLVETAITAIPGSRTNIIDGKFVTLSGAATVPRPSSGYFNSIDTTPNYTYLKVQPEVGWNSSLNNNNGRTGIYANRVKLVHEGQGDATAYNASVRVRARPRLGTSNWIASPAGVLFNGTISGESDGVYLNPFEIHMTDTPVTTSYNVAAYGIVINGGRNKEAGPGPRYSGDGIGQVWGGARFQSEGSVPWDNILSAEGKFSTGIDLSMGSADFGVNKAAIALKANDRLYFDCKAVALDNNKSFIRQDRRATSCGSYISFNDTSKSLDIYIENKLVTSISSAHPQVGNSVADKPHPGIDKSNASDSIDVTTQGLDQTRVGGRAEVLDSKIQFKQYNSSDITIQQLATRVAAIESALSQKSSSDKFVKP